MKSVQRSFLLFTTLILIAACTPNAATKNAPTQTPRTEPTFTAQPTLTATATLEPASAPPPTAYPTIASTPVQPVTGLPQGTDSYPWWNDAVFYEIFVRSFYDSDGDGIGDFNGITEKLDYLNDGDPNTTTDLGITGLWLMPIHPSPSYHGYDVTDYYAVNPEYGTMDDFRRLLEEAHKRGIRVTIDWVLNHTSSQHEWFQQAKDPQSPYHDWYVWSANPTSSPKWTRVGDEYYYANFVPEMPDLNYLNPAVVQEMEKVIRFWLQDVGIDGFRLDAAKHIIEEGSTFEDTPETHNFYKELRKFYKGVDPQAMMVGEVTSNSSIVQTYIVGDELDLAFDFDLAKQLIFSAGTHTPKYAADQLRRDVGVFLPGQFATFLSNHDQDRAMSVLNDKPEDAKAAAMLLLTSPGVPFLYYGEEIGLLGKKPDENIRLPMQWTDETNGGFTSGSPWRAPNSDFTTKNVSAQGADPNSLLSFYRELIRIRNNHAALRVGDFQIIDTENRSVYASLRVSSGEALLILINMSDSPVSDYALRLHTSSLSGNYSVKPLLGYGEYSPLQVNAQGGFENYLPLPEIPAYERLILQLQKE